MARNVNIPAMTAENNTPPPGLLKNPVYLLALGFGAGLVPRMPGTAGTAVAVIIYIPMHTLSLPIYLGVVCLMFFVGIWCCGRASERLGVHDHRGIVWDEIVGYLTAMTFAPVGWPWAVLGFVLFRLFDIWKPWPIRWLDRSVRGGAGIMLDDLAAALYSGVLMQLIAYILKI